MRILNNNTISLDLVIAEIFDVDLDFIVLKTFCCHVP